MATSALLLPPLHLRHLSRFSSPCSSRRHWYTFATSSCALPAHRAPPLPPHARRTAPAPSATQGGVAAAVKFEHRGGRVPAVATDVSGERKEAWAWPAWTWRRLSSVSPWQMRRVGKAGFSALLHFSSGSGGQRRRSERRGRPWLEKKRREEKKRKKIRAKLSKKTNYPVSRKNGAFELLTRV